MVQFVLFHSDISFGMLYLQISSDIGFLGFYYGFFIFVSTLLYDEQKTK